MQTDILIVEDSPTQAAQLEETLRRRGYETQTAANGSEALEIIRRARPALVLSDVRMPVMDGFRLCRAIKQDPDLCRIPVILLTEWSSPADVLSALQAGADFHIPKPCQADFLLEKIDTILASGSESGRTEPETPRTVTHDGIAYQVSASPDHVLRLLLSTYEVAIQQNRELLSARKELEQTNRTLQVEIVERKSTEKAVDLERQRLYDVLETLPVYVVLLSADYHVPFANRFFRERFGESEGRRCYEYLFNRAAPCESCEMFTVFKTAAPHHWEWIGPDGRNYDIFDYPFTDTDGAPLVLEMGIDITETKRAQAALAESNESLERRVAERTTELRLSEAALRESLARTRAITQSAHDAIITADSAGNIVGWNLGAESIFGYTESEAMSLSVTELIPEQFRARHLAGMRAITDGGAPRIIGKTVELTGLRKGGIDFPLDLSLARWETADGWFFTAFIRDITDRLRAETVIRLESAALEAAANAIVITDREGVIEWANAAFTTFNGYRIEEVVGCRPGELLKSGKHGEAFYREMWHTIQSGSVWHGEIVNKRRDGSEYTEEMTITPLKNARREITHFIAVKQDITQRKILEEQFRQSQKMEAVGRLAGGVAHDFNNMLSVISGRSELAMLHLNPEHPVRAHLLEIEEAARRSVNLTRQLLAFARQQTLAPRLLDLNEAVTNSLRMLQRLIGENIQLAWQPAEDLWPIMMDPSQLDQILANLCVNARDAIADVGTLVITTANIVLDAAICAIHEGALPGEYVQLTVSDTGCGMDSTTLAQIFEPFFTTKAIGEGTGLGLATVYGAVRQHHGFVTVSSAPGLGTTFEIYLPRHVGEAESTPAPRPATASHGGHETILVVEDEAVVLRLTTKMLEAQGYVVLGAGSSREAVCLVKEHEGTIDLVLTDVVMPEMNGHDLVKELKVLAPHLKHLYMSGYAVNFLGDHGMIDRETSMVEKPFTMASLAAAVREALDGKQDHR